MELRGTWEGSRSQLREKRMEQESRRIRIEKGEQESRETTR
jgi:hypothetical protein